MTKKAGFLDYSRKPAFLVNYVTQSFRSILMTAFLVFCMQRAAYATR